MDENVIDIPALGRALLVYGIILPKRTHKSLEAYQSIWEDDGSPLLSISRDFATKVSERFDIPVKLGMRYGKLSLESAIRDFEREGVTKIVVVPMYPQYAMATTLSVEKEVARCVQKHRIQTPIEMMQPFYKHPKYIASLTNRLETELNRAHYDHVLFSYHGVPVRQLEKMDRSGTHCMASAECCETVDPEIGKYCYRHQVLDTTRLVTESLSAGHPPVSLSFQSRLGNDVWTTPATTDVLDDLAAKGVKRLLILSPAFVADCLETLEELAIEGKEQFLAAGGEELHCLPCLNSGDDWVAAFGHILTELHWKNDNAGTITH